MHQYHVGVLGMHFVEAIPDEAMVVELDTTREGDLRACGDQHLVLGAALGSEEVATVDEGRCQRAVIDDRA